MDHPSRPPVSDEIGVTWLGHATALLDVGGMRVLTDPVLTPRVAHLRRRRPLSANALGPIDLVLLSHAHMDHLHLPSLRIVGSDTAVVVPVGAGAWLRRRGFANVSELPVGGRLDVGPVTVRAVPADHRSGRGPHTRLDVSPVGYVVSNDQASVYFPGDTDLIPAMNDLRGVDVALLPIWGWGPTIGEGHLDPERAVIAARRLDPGLVVPIHWGTYSPVRSGRVAPRWLDEPADRFTNLMASTDLHDRVQLLLPGESLRYRSGTAVRC